MSSVAFLMAALATPSFAQTAVGSEDQQKFSDQELENFVKVVKVQQDGENEMIAAIKRNGLEIQEFNDIMMAQQNPELESPIVEEEDMEKFDKATTEVLRIQKDVQTEMMGKINDSGLGMQTYNAIVSAYQADPVVKQKIDGLLSGN